MRYKAIAAGLGAASLLAMGIAAAEESVKRRYSIDGAGTTDTQGPDPTTMASESLAPVDKATPPADSRVRADCVPMTPLLVVIGFGGGLCAPAQGDGNLIHHCRERERTHHPHRDLPSVSAARQKPFIALQ